MYTISFEIKGDGKAIPSSGYALFGALSKVLPAIHYNGKFKETKQIYPVAITGTRIKDKILLNKDSKLLLRAQSIDSVVGLIGKELTFQDANIHVGTIEKITPIAESLRLYGPYITYEGKTKPEEVIASIKTELEKMNIPCISVELTAHPDGTPRTRWMQVKNWSCLGYAAIIKIPGSYSIQLQEQGLGGRRHFGCGVLYPVREVKYAIYNT